MNKSGISINEDAFVLLARLSGNDTQLQAGAYEAVRGDTPRSLLERMAHGDPTQTRQPGRAHVRTPVTTAHLVSRPIPAKQTTAQATTTTLNHHSASPPSNDSH